MRLIYLLWGYPYDEAIIRAFQAEGFIVELIKLPQEFLPNKISDEKWDIIQENDLEDLKKYLKNKMSSCSGEIVFSVNFNAVISDFCQKEALPYCSWVLQLPNFDLYTKAVFNACNYLGICDSYLVEKMWKLGIEKAFFLPDAIELGEKEKEVSIERKFCFIAKHPKEVLKNEEMTLYGKGYLDAFLHAQRVLLGTNILENGLTNRVYREFLSCNSIPSTILPEMQKLFVADCYLAPICTSIQQNIFMKNNENLMTIYSDSSFDRCLAKKYPYVSEEKERRKIYAGKEFSLVLAPHVLHNGIPRDTLEVIAAGGFPICSFQKDYSYFFKRDENLAYFTNAAELNQTIIKYGNNPKERERVKENAYKVVSEEHTYQHRIVNMLEMWEKL